jgi:putative ABC transport system substrate-binding protein
VNKREFITLLGSAAAAWPLAARAQQRERMRRIGVLMPGDADNPDNQARLAAFLQGLQQFGWAVGRNLRIDLRWAAGEVDRNRQYAEELVGLAPDVILAVSSGVSALKQATRTVPIVFTIVADPVGLGFVDNMARPGGNITGFIAFEYGMSGKWLELLKQVATGVTRAAVVRDPANPIRCRTVCRRCLGRAGAWRGYRSSQCERSQRAGKHAGSIRPLAEWRRGCDRQCICHNASRPDHQARGPASIARGLL